MLSTAAALAQPAVPAVPPLRSTQPPAPRTATPAPSAPRAAAPVADADAPPTSAPFAAAPATATTTATAPSAAAAADAPPTSDAPTKTASATPNAAAATEAEASGPALPPTVTKNYPLTPEGNARFLADYAARPDVKKLDGGVLYRVLHAAEAKSNGPLVNNDTVTVSYRGWLIDGTAFDQTKPGAPIPLSLSAVIPGWRTALMKMKVGDLWEIAIPSDQAYGAEGRPGRIPPNQTLVFVVSLAKVEYAG
ncbi:MAG: FKBP-type peptidyl-prolyl cis-trans isomerase [Alphaproteobacteria bacterium]|nr:FKBP-type peptidyl-prolyl cis-trans isomerase [Alphaproteobacteria bacterium]